MKAELQRRILRGRRPVRADRRLRTDDETVRTQSAILYEDLRGHFRITEMAPDLGEHERMYPLILK